MYGDTCEQPIEYIIIFLSVYYFKNRCNTLMLINDFCEALESSLHQQLNIFKAILDKLT